MPADARGIDRGRCSPSVSLMPNHEGALSRGGFVYAEALQATLRSAAKTSLRLFCSYGVPLLTIALSAWAAVRIWAVHIDVIAEYVCDV